MKTAVELAERYTAAQLEDKMTANQSRILERRSRIETENRAYTDRETALNEADNDEYGALYDALNLRRARDDDRAAVDAGRVADELENFRRTGRGDEQSLSPEARRQYVEGRDRSLEVSRGLHQAAQQRPAVDLMAGFRELEERAFRGEGGRFSFSIEDFEVFTRSTTTTNAGGAHVAPGAGSGGGGLWLPNEVGAQNLNLAPGTRIEAGVYAANSAVAATAEATAKPALDPTSLATSIVSAYAVTSNISIQSQLSGQGVAQFTWAGTRKVRKSVNDSFVAAMVAAGGTARPYATSAVASMDGAIATAMDAIAGVPDLIVVDAAQFSALASAGGGQLSTSAVPSYRGIRLVPSAQASLAGNALVLDGSALAMSLSGVEVRTHPQITTNSLDALVEVWFAVSARGSSGVILQDITA